MVGSNRGWPQKAVIELEPVDICLILNVRMYMDFIQRNVFYPQAIRYVPNAAMLRGITIRKCYIHPSFWQRKDATLIYQELQHHIYGSPHYERIAIRE